MFRHLAFAAIILMTTHLGLAQTKPISFEQLRSFQVSSTKPVAVLIITDWCKYCHAMQNTMIKNSKISQLLNSKFHTIFLNAEQTSDIFFAGRTFKFRQGLNELARELSSVNGKVSYPTLTIMNAKNEIIFQHGGFLSPQAMLYSLKRLAEN